MTGQEVYTCPVVFLVICLHCLQCLSKLVRAGGGLSAAGKSSVLVDPLSEYYSSRIIDSDMAKEELDEFDNGLGANAVHRESQDIIKNVLAQSISNGDNIVYPIVGGGDINSLIGKINILNS